MSKPSRAERLEVRAELFPALGHPVRLLSPNLVRMRPRPGQELAEILGLKPATLSHPRAKLAGAGLLESREDQYDRVYALAAESLRPTSTT